MELSQIYVGLVVKVDGREGIYQIIRIDDYTMSTWCNKINSIDHDLREVRLQDLRRL